MRIPRSALLLGCASVLVGASAQGAGLQPGRTDDTLEDVVLAADNAEDVANMANYANRIVVLPPYQPVIIPVDGVAMPLIAPEVSPLAVQANGDELLALFVFGGLAGLPLLLGNFGGGASGVPAASTGPLQPISSGGLPAEPGGAGLVPGQPSGPAEQPEQPLAPPPLPTPAIPEPATWAMLLLGFAAVGSGLRRSSPRRRSAVLADPPVTARSVLSAPSR